MLSAIGYDLYDLEGFNREIVEQSTEHAMLQHTPTFGLLNASATMTEANASEDVT